jgi:ketosteroid isomerase-like protein
LRRWRPEKEKLSVRGRNKTIFLRFIKELGKGNLGIIDEVCSPDFAFHSPNFPEWPRGLEGARKLAAAGRSMFADAQTKAADIFAVDDKVVLRSSINGTYIGEAKHGFPKPGERFAMGVVAIYRFVDGKIVDDWGIQVSCPTDTPWG